MLNPREPNGKSLAAGEVEFEQPEVGMAANANTSTAVNPSIPSGRVSTMAGRQRDRDSDRDLDVARPSGSGGIHLSADLVFKVIGFLVAFGAGWYSLKSDLRDMRTTMDFQVRIQEERWESQQTYNREMKARYELLSLTVGDIEKSLIRAGIDVSDSSNDRQPTRPRRDP